MLRNIFNAFLFSLMVCSSAVFAAALTSLDAVYYHQQACNFGEAWDKGYSGAGVIIGIIDDSIKMDHPAYYARIINDKCKFFVNGQEDGTTGSNPRNSGSHGTAVAGCAAAKSPETQTILGGRSGYIAGAAYEANLIGVGTDLGDNSITSAFNYLNNLEDKCSVINNSYGVSTGFVAWMGSKANSFGIISSDRDSVNGIPKIHAAANNGSILLFSAGNERSGNKRDDSSGEIYACQQDSNKKAFQACVDTLVVAATGSYTAAYDQNLYQQYAPFSCYGANVFCCAPGTTVPTSAKDGDGYMESFSGTSASSPVAAGVVALGVEALKTNPNVETVTPRLMKHLLVQTCAKIDLGATGEETAWTTNGAGITFSPTYGFGQVDAGTLVTAAETTMDVTAQTVLAADWGWTNSASGSTVCDLGILSTPREIFYRGTISGGGWDNPGGSVTSYGMETLSADGIRSDACLTTMGYTLDNSPATNNGQISTMGATDTQTFYATFSTDTFEGVSIQPLEEVTLTILAESNYLGDIQIELTSPSQTKSILCYEEAVSNSLDLTYNDLIWTFSSNAFWGEDPTGEWKVEVKDKEDHGTEDDTGIAVKGISTTFYMGQIQTAPLPDDKPVPEPGTWALLILGSFGLFWLKRRH